MINAILPLRLARASRIVGQKAKNLSTLERLGFTIPKSVVVPVSVFRKQLKRQGLLPIVERLQNSNSAPELLAEIRRTLQNAPVLAELKNRLEKLLLNWQQQGVQSLAVRSSAINEDLPTFSFAGQYHTSLNVPLTVEAVVKAINEVWASAFNDSVWDYYLKNELSFKRFGMAVILQEMVDPLKAGVAFSQNPQMPESEEILVEYVEGLGKDLVDGEAEPRRIVVPRRKLTNPVSEDLPGFEKFLQDLLRLEKTVGFPVDVEWALAKNSTYYFLQFRAITALKNAVIWTNENVGEVIPDVVTPFSWSILKPITNGGYQYFLRHVGLRQKNQQLFTLYEGKVYFNHNAFQQTLQAFYLSQYLQPGISLFKKITNVGTLLYRLGRLGAFSVQLPAKIRRVTAKKLPASEIPEGWNEKRLLSELKQCLREIKKVMNVHVSCSIFAEIYYQLLDKFCKEHFPDTEMDASRLLQGIGEVESTRTARALWEIAQWIKTKPQYVEFFQQHEPSEIVEWVRDLPEGSTLKTQIEVFLETFGHASLHEFEILYPRWREDPTYVFLILKQYLTGNLNDIDVQDRLRSLETERDWNIKKAEELLKNAGKSQKILFGYLLKKAEYFSFEREVLKQRLVRLFDRLKRLVTGLNRRFFEEPDAIFYLTLDEISRVVREGSVAETLQLRINERREQRSRQLEMKHPERLKQIGDQWIPLWQSEPAEGVWSGLPCSAGVVEGRAHVLLNPEQSGDFKAGDILVTRATNPGWTPLISIAGGIVSEIGGALSHGAIIAREFGIPMVAAVKDATRLIKTGQMIRVDGQNGTIEILSKE